MHKMTTKRQNMTTKIHKTTETQDDYKDTEIKLQRDTEWLLRCRNDYKRIHKTTTK